MIAVITAMEVELQALLARLEQPERQEAPGLSDCWLGTLHGRQVVAAVCGVGKVCAAQCTQQIICRYHPRAVLHSGVAGGLAPELGHLDLVVGQRLTYRDMTEKVKRENLPFGGWFDADPAISALLLEEAPDARSGVIATGDLFVESEEEKSRLYRDYQAVCAEMEGAAVAHVCAVNGVPFGVVRCISDLANGQAYADYKQFEQLGSQKSAQLLCRVIERMAD